MHTDDISNLLENVLNMRRTPQVEILTTMELKELNLLRHLIFLKTNPDWERGMDKEADQVVDEHKLSNDFLRGLKAGLGFSLQTVSFVSVADIDFLTGLYISCNSLILEESNKSL